MNVLRPRPESSLDRTAPRHTMWRCRGKEIRRLVLTAPRHTMWRCRGTEIRRLVVTATAPHRATTLPNRFSRSLRSLLHPSRDACSWLSLCSSTLTSARRGGGRERLHAATRGKAGKRLASGVTLSNQLTQLVDTRQTNNLRATWGKAGKRLAVGVTLCNPLTQPPILHA